MVDDLPRKVAAALRSALDAHERGAFDEIAPLYDQPATEASALQAVDAEVTATIHDLDCWYDSANHSWMYYECMGGRLAACGNTARFRPRIGRPDERGGSRTVHIHAASGAPVHIPRPVSNIVEPPESGQRSRSSVRQFTISWIGGDGRIVGANRGEKPPAVDGGGVRIRRMRRLFLITGVVALVAVVYVKAQVRRDGPTGPRDEEQAVRNVLAQCYEGWNAHDVDTMVSIYAEDIDHINVFGAVAQGQG